MQGGIVAGDWMKIELELPDKPEVHSIAGILNIDSDCVVGKLIRVWQWFDKHTKDGHAHGVTFSLPDRISGVTGFGEAMMFVGWLEQKDKVLVMPKFDRHTSASAKKRATDQKRQSNHRSTERDNVAVLSQVERDKSVTREEKRREDEKKNIKKKIPDGFSPSENNIQFASENELDVSTEFDQFVSHHKSKGSTFADWNAAFRTWLGNAAKWKSKQPSYQSQWDDAI